MGILQELQRRKVIRVAGVYLVVAWLLLQIADTIAPTLGLPEWFEGLVLALLGLGFPVALILAWALELTPDGVRGDSGDAPSPGNMFVDYTILALIVVAAGWYFLRDVDIAVDERPTGLDRSVAILPFENLNNDDANAALTAGIHSDLLGQLSRIGSLRTISRTSMLRYRGSDKSVPEIADELGVAAVLEGGVQRAGNTVRINVTLIDASADTPLWTEVYDRELTAANIFAIQSEIARAIGEQLQATLSLEEQQRLNVIPTSNTEALEAYFVGKQLMEGRTLESLIAATEYFDKVVELDQNFALGWSGVADSYMLLPEYQYSADRAAMQARSQLAVERALAIDPSLPEVRATNAWYQLRAYDWDGAEATFREALAVAPDNTNALHWLSHTLAWLGEFEEAIDVARRCVEVDPGSLFMKTNLAYILVDARMYEEGLQLSRELIRNAPDHIVQQRNHALHSFRAGDARAGADAFVAYTGLTGGDVNAAARIGEMIIAYNETGQRGSITPDLIADTQLSRQLLAQYFAFVGNAEQTIAELQAAVAEDVGSRAVFSMKINPAYDFIRDDPRFVALLQEVGLAD